VDIPIRVDRDRDYSLGLRREFSVGSKIKRRFQYTLFAPPDKGTNREGSDEDCPRARDLNNVVNCAFCAYDAVLR
jgi:hypothetical protein